ncbi:hypothetical protein D9758_010856 [Tetrapyrgos nigripes]|uniref:HAT C-terminal dimerisation domain-containing protein n=1 Tax=Tetrapyrgos nigripes TaxID=182062 RepID=A0A8H5GHZ3_9AGAR|nr:hypothetical protein D9758_010856 [Tetrapyrgos nigripes]
MIRRARCLKEAIDEWVFRHEEFRDLGLSKEDWKRLEQLEEILEVFTVVTNVMSRADTPTLPYVLPMYRKMEQKLMHVKNDPVLASFSEAIDAGIRKLDKYHQLAKSNQFYVVATVCHPSFRLNWFGKRSSTDYQRAKILFEHVYESYVATAPAGPNGTSPVKPKKSTASDDLVQSLVDDIVSDSDDGLPMSQDRAASKLERYLLGEGGRGDSMKPLDWWKKHAKITEDTRGFPIISRIARDFLAIPGTSVSVERLFSSSRHLCSDLRSSMKAETTTLAMCAKVWLKSGLFEFDSRKLISGRKRVEEKPVSN